ncbi:hypothetical protein EI42_01245 [Thermosporothrix hazakensis]|jgi:hypothetical protein|uniref:Response regulatory domain-containing protein n=2 Tax=Thermosporothrix TaxID=768650 RepID=A0A326UC79_THEHA|nr:hypothetical protein [Thermosporothrix hazakensis]PZW34408.1 hypothetical protein EI42_01245 [Thermosporothrix hazakensis]BBH85531.1 hypothetical protein KTC_02820 [Thermosporothrix sp. COM3]GCE46042.1 hypothetical protein KTH_09110 [Thermosporothrix hazakensis]
MKQAFFHTQNERVFLERTILIIEEDLDRGYQLARTLRAETPYRVLYATNYFQAEKMMQCQSPDVLIANVHVAEKVEGEWMTSLQIFVGGVEGPLSMMHICANGSGLVAQHLTKMRRPYMIPEVVALVKSLLV